MEIVFAALLVVPVTMKLGFILASCYSAGTKTLSFECVLFCEDPFAAVINVVSPFGVFLLLTLVDDDVRLDLAV
jgi:hypothetical protein